MSEAATKDDFRAVAVMLERLESKVDAVVEQTSMRDELKREMNAMEQRLLRRIEAIEDVLRSHSIDIRES